MLLDPKTLRNISQEGLQSFAQGHILDGISALHTLLPYVGTEDVVRAGAESLEKNYHYMLSFLRSGGDDEKRREVQAKLQRRGAVLVEHASRAIRLSQASDHYSKAFNRLKDNYENPATDIPAKWQGLLTPEETPQVQDDLFDLLWTSPVWTAQDTALWYDFLSRQRDIVQQHLIGAIFLSTWEHYDAEKVGMLCLMAVGECHRTRLSATAYLLLLRLRHKELVPLMPPLPDSLRSKRGKSLVAQVQYEMLLMLLSEQDMRQEMEESETLTKNMLSGQKDMSLQSIKDLIELKGRYLKNRLERGLDPNLSKAPLLHSCKYMQRVSHWFLPFDKTHPLFQSIMIDDAGNEKQSFSLMMDLVMDCDVDKMATLYLMAHDKDFSKAIRQMDEQQLPNMEGAEIPEYNIRFIMQDLYRFFFHSPLSQQLRNPFREEQPLLDQPDLAPLFTPDEYVSCCNLLFETGHGQQAIDLLDELISREGASASALHLKGLILTRQKKYAEAVSCLRAAEVLQPDKTSILRLLAECCAALHRFEEELEYLQRLSELHPDDLTYRRLLPMALVKTGKREEALKLLFKLDYEMSDGDLLIIDSIAAIAFTSGKLDIAERYTEKSEQLRLQKADTPAFGTADIAWSNQLRMGHIRLLQGNWKESIDHYEQFINRYCEMPGKDAKAAIAQFDREQDMLVSRGIAREDILLIHDILQSATENAPGPEA